MNKPRTSALCLAILCVLLLGSCDMINSFIASRTRNIALIQLYNSNKEKTNKLQPNDTLFVEVQGLKANSMYQVECQGPDGKTITMLTAQADGDGIITPSPLWYDVGFEVDKTTKKLKLPSKDTELTLRTFNVRVVALDSEDKTDLKLSFYIVYNTGITRPQPIVIAGKNLDTSGTKPEIQLENSFKSGEELWVQVFNLDELPLQVPLAKKARVYVVSAKSSAYEDGDDIANVIFYKDCTVDELKTGIKLDSSQLPAGQDFTPNSNSWATIPAWAEGKAFSVIVDVDNNSKYNLKKEGTDDFYLDGIDGNMVPGFVVRFPPPPPITTVEYAPANIASGGIYRYDYTKWDYDYDYRDEFIITGNDTRYAWDWQYGGYGIKATWNPYLRWDGWDNQGALNNASLYYGDYVDVYIIDSQATATNPYPEGEAIVASTKWGLSKLTLPVQYSCYNGCGQQTIWRSDSDSVETNGGLKIGDYDVVVDVNRDGKFSDGDIIDNQPSDASAKYAAENAKIPPVKYQWPARTNGGFSVIAAP